MFVEDAAAGAVLSHFAEECRCGDVPVTDREAMELLPNTGARPAGLRPAALAC